MLWNTIVFMVLWLVSEEVVWKKTSEFPADFIGVATWPTTELAKCLNMSRTVNLCRNHEYWGNLFTSNTSTCTVICTGVINDGTTISFMSVDLPEFTSLTVMYQYYDDVDECASVDTDTMENNDDGQTDQPVTQGAIVSSTTEKEIFGADQCIELDDNCLVMVDVHKIFEYYTSASMPLSCSNAGSPSDCAEKCLDSYEELKPVLLIEGQALFLFWNESTKGCRAGYLQKQTSEISDVKTSDSQIYLIHPNRNSCAYIQRPNISSMPGFTAPIQSGTDMSVPIFGLYYMRPVDTVFVTVWKSNQITFPLNECDHMCPQNFYLATINKAFEAGTILKKFLSKGNSNKILAIGLYLNIIYNETSWADNTEDNFKDTRSSPELYDTEGRIQSRFVIQQENGKLIWKSARIDSEVHQCLCRLRR